MKVRQLVKPMEFEPQDIVFEPDHVTQRMYRVIEVLAVKSNRTIVHVMRRDGDEVRELPNHVDYPVEREA